MRAEFDADAQTFRVFGELSMLEENQACFREARGFSIRSMKLP